MAHDTSEDEAITPLSKRSMEKLYDAIQDLSTPAEWQKAVPKLDLANPQHLVQYIDWRLDQWEDNGFKDEYLFNEYQTDFFNFTTTVWKMIPSTDRIRVRTYLWNHGVYVESKQNVKLWDSLPEAAIKWTPWPVTKPRPDAYVHSKPIPIGVPVPPQPGSESAVGTGGGGGGSTSGGTTTYQFPIPPDQQRVYTPEELLAMSGNMPAHGFSRELTNMEKMYAGKEKYSGKTGEMCFALALPIFLECCVKAELPSHAYPLAFSTMLKDEALSYYYMNLHGKGVDTATLIKVLTAQFEGPEQTRTKLTEWNFTSLRQQILLHPERSWADTFKDMVDNLKVVQRSLDITYQTPKVLIDKITASVADIPVCATALLVSYVGVSGLTNNITSALINDDMARTAEKIRPLGRELSASINYTDRTFREDKNPSSSRNNSRNDFRKLRNNTNIYSRKKTCYICREPGCWSTKHTKDEQEQMRKTFTKKYPQKTYQAFLADYEGEEDDNHTLIQDECSDNEYFLCGSSSVNKELASSYYNDLIQHTLQHAMSGSQIFYSLSRYTSDVFRGVLVDTGAATISTVGLGQAKVFMKEFGVQMDTNSPPTMAKFGKGKAISQGTLAVETPVGKMIFYVVDADIPFLLCLQDLDRSGYYYNNQTDLVTYKNNTKPPIPITRIFNHPFMVWGPVSIAYLTEPELRQLHRRFGHPSVDRLVKLLEKTNHEDPQNRQVLKDITAYCEFCQKHSRSPGRFKFSLKDEDNTYFNYALVVDVMYIEGDPVLHVVDQGTSFQAGRWLQSISAKHTWDMLRLCWIDVYTGPPEVIIHDAGTNFDSVEFRESSTALGIQTKCVPVEAPQSVGLVERYHAPLRRAYMIITQELKDQAISKEMKLQMAFKAINDTAGYNGLVPTLLVFGAYPRISSLDAPSVTTMERARVIKLAMKEVMKIRANRQITDALQQRNGPQTAVHEWPVGSSVLVWRIHQKKWTGPYRLLSIEGETCSVLVDDKPTSFRSTIVKPFKIKSPSVPDFTPPVVETVVVTPPQPRRSPRFTAAQLTVFTPGSLTQPPPSPNFIASRRKELNGLLERGVFKVCHKGEVPDKTRIFGSRFVDTLKFPGTDKAFEKSRLVVQAYNDKGKKDYLLQAPTIQRSSQRLILTASLARGDEIWVRDVTQAYTQAKTKLMRRIFIKAPKEMDLEDDFLIEVILPLYGVPEAATHWFGTIVTHYSEELKMLPSTFDACLMYRSDGSALVGLQTDDSLISATPAFMIEEEAALQKANFIAKPVEKLTEDHPLDFNGFVIQKKGITLEITQKKQVAAIKLLTKEFTKAEYVSQRARGAYVATVSQPQAAFDLSYAAQVTNPTWEDAQFLNKRLHWQMQGSGLTFVKLDPDSLRIMAFVDASFANNNDHSSQIGYVIVLADESGAANVVHWQSIKCKRVTRSVLASELYALVLGFDISATLKSTSDQIFSCSPQENRKIPLIMCTDSLSLYDCLTKLGTTLEKRLMIDILSIRQSYERREIAEILWIAGDSNPADSMTKSKPCEALQQMIDSNKLDLRVQKWVERAEISLAENEEIWRDL